MNFKKITAFAAAAVIAAGICTGVPAGIPTGTGNGSPLAITASAAKSTLIENDGLIYIENENGNVKLYTGWTKKSKSGKRFYYKNGKMLKSCWLTKKGVRQYYLTSDGSAATGKVTISGTEYEFDSKGKLVQDEWDIKTEATDISSTGLTLVTTISNDSYKGEFSYSSPYTIEKLSENNWKPLTVINEIDWLDYDEFFDIGINKHIFQWEDLYGQLPKGRYRICKNIYKNTDNKSDSKIYYTYFTIS